MKVSLRKGISYGTTSGVITSLGLLVGLYSASSSQEVILAGLLTIAFADALSDGLGIHVSEEAENHHSAKSIWESTITTVVSKMILGLTFIPAVVFFPLETAMLTNVVWGFFVLSFLSYRIAKQNNAKITAVLLEHLGLSVFVIIGSYFIGRLIGSIF